MIISTFCIYDERTGLYLICSSKEFPATLEMDKDDWRWTDKKEAASLFGTFWQAQTVRDSIDRGKVMENTFILVDPA